MNFILLVLLCSVLGLFFSAYQGRSIMKEDEGDEKVRSIAIKIRKGANAYLKRQYKGVTIFFVIMFVIFLIMSLFGYVSIFVPFSFVIGGFLSGLSGFIGMKVATQANSRTTTAAKKSLNGALKISFKSGSVIGIVVVSLGLLYIALGFIFLDWYYRDLSEAERILQVTTNILTFGIGASSMALFARVGGGIFTKAADVGADLVAGSLIKNIGGGIAPTGGYIAGKKEYVDQAAYRLTIPGIGGECGSTFGVMRTLFQGLFLAPHVAMEAVKGAILCSRIMELAGFEVLPKYTDKRSDIIQAIKFGNKENLINFCKGIQKGSPVDSFVECEPWAMPGYADEVIMAAGAFIQGSSIELSADAPIREPFIAYLQGGLTFDHAKIGILIALSKILK